MFTTTHCELAASIECSVGLKQPAPQSGGSVGVGVGKGVRVIVGVGVGASVGLVKPGGSPIAVGVGAGV